MAWHHLVNQIIECEKQEIELYRKIAQGAPTEGLRNMVLNMAEHERRELDYWYNMLKCNSMGGYTGGPYQAEEKKEPK